MVDKFFYPDVISVIRRDGTRADNIPAQVSRKITTYDDKESIDDGDEIQRVRSDGKIDRFLVLDNGYAAKAGPFQAHYSIKYEKINDLPRRENSPITIYNLNGENSRVNNQSHDQSINVVNTYNEAPVIFSEMRKAIEENVENEADRRDLLARVTKLEEAYDSPGFLEAYKDFLSQVGAYMSILSAFIPALAQMLHR